MKGDTQYDKDMDRTKKNQGHELIWRINPRKMERNRRKKDRNTFRQDKEKGRNPKTEKGKSTG